MSRVLSLQNIFKMFQNVKNVCLRVIARCPKVCRSTTIYAEDYNYNVGLETLQVLTSAVKKRFPKLKRLDEEDMPVEIGFEVETEEEQKQLPSPLKLGSSSPEALELIKAVSASCSVGG